ncbi:hypothetical protein GWK47_044988 [Chionoecetes opilio]|uniref:Uncharacterized protein n=1 Tax=Chionoecetes opilio TaxID=41210 RepID=A0A8J5CHX0_CHIOP|nr:hypothetical protein GWK47_044988 [Chionoecetes opilio]
MDEDRPDVTPFHLNVKKAVQGGAAAATSSTWKGDGAEGQGLVPQAMEVQAVVLKAEASLATLLCRCVDGKHQPSVQQVPGVHRQAAEVLHLQGERRRVEGRRSWDIIKNVMPGLLL